MHEEVPFQARLGIKAGRSADPSAQGRERRWHYAEEGVPLR